MLVPHAERYLAEQALGLSRVLESTRIEMAGLERLANRHPERSREFGEWSEALQANANLFAELRGEILPYCETAEICDAAAHVADPRQNEGNGLDKLGQSLALARRDWSGEETCEREIHGLINAAVMAIDRDCRDPVQLLVLGSGMGRMAEVLSRRYDRTCAIEFLLPVELLRRKLHVRPVTLYSVDTRNRRLASQMVQRVELTDRALPGESRCDFVVGDARRAPWADGTFSCVLSAYFTDVLPYSTLLPEITRLLRPGGVFVHLGPLAYHHHDAGEHLAADQLAGMLERCGYAVLQADWVTTTLRDDPTSLYRHICDNLVLTARKTDNAAGGRQQLNADVILGVREGIVLSTEVMLSERSARIVRSELKTANGTPVVLSPLVTRMIEVADGRTTFGEMVSRVESMLATGRLPEGERNRLSAALGRLVDVGALRIVRRPATVEPAASDAGPTRRDSPLNPYGH